MAKTIVSKTIDLSSNLSAPAEERMLFKKGTKEGLLWIGIVLGVTIAVLPGVLYKVAKEYKKLKAKEMQNKVLKYYK